MATGKQAYGRYIPQHSNDPNSVDQSSEMNNYDKRDFVETKRQRPNQTSKDIQVDHNKLRQVHDGGNKSNAAKGFCTPRNIIIGVVVAVIIAAIAVGIALAVVFATKSSSNSTTTTTTTTTTGTSQTTTTATTATTQTTTTSPQNPCSSGNGLWSTTGISILATPRISYIVGLYFDSNNTLYITDENNYYVVWRYSYNASNASIVAGTYQSAGSAATQFNYPQYAAVDLSNNLYVTDYYNHRLQKFAAGSTTGTTIAGISGSASSSLNYLYYPRNFAIDAVNGSLYIADSYNHRIIRFSTTSTSGTAGVLVAGGNGAGNGNTTLYYPFSVDYLPSVSNDLFIASTQSHAIIRWTPGAASGYFIAGVPGVAGQSPVLLNYPTDVKVDTYLNMYVVDYNNHRVQMFCPGSQIGITIAGTGVAGSGSTQLYNPRNIAFDSYMNMYVSDYQNRRVQQFLKL